MTTTPAKWPLSSFPLLQNEDDNSDDLIDRYEGLMRKLKQHLGSSVAVGWMQDLLIGSLLVRLYLYTSKIQHAKAPPDCKLPLASQAPPLSGWQRLDNFLQICLCHSSTSYPWPRPSKPHCHNLLIPQPHPHSPPRLPIPPGTSLWQIHWRRNTESRRNAKEIGVYFVLITSLDAWPMLPRNSPMMWLFSYWDTGADAWYSCITSTGSYS